MRPLILISLSLVIICVCSNAFSQSTDGLFKIRTIPDNGWFLKLEKDNTYRYYYSSAFGEGTLTLDSGIYVLRNDSLTFNSKFKIPPSDKHSSLSSHYFVYSYKVSKKTKSCLNIRTIYRNKLFRKHIFIISRKRITKDELFCEEIKERTK